MTPRGVILAGFCSIAAAAPPGLNFDSDAARNQSGPCGKTAEQFNVSIAVDDVEAAFGRVDAAMVAAGAASQADSNDFVIRNDGRGEVRVRQAHYSFPLKVAEKAARKVWEFGALTHYSADRRKPGAAGEKYDKQIEQIESELADGEADLAEMPAARYFLNEKLSKLRQARDSCRPGSSFGEVIVSLRPKPAGPKR